MNIIIVKYKSPIEEEKCLASVRKHTDLTKHTLTVFDNEPENINLGKLWNQLIEESEDENICLLNSDTLVEEGWDRLEESLSREDVGAVGPITNRCGGNQKNLTRAESIENINDLSGFCYLFTKTNWRKVGKMPEDMPFYGQETVFNRKLEDHGLKLVVDRRVFIHHEKGASWFKAKERGEMTMDQVHMGAFHYHNYVRRLATLREKVPFGVRVAFMGAGEGNIFPTFRGVDQTISDFFGENAKHFPMEASFEEIMEFKPDVLIVAQSRYHGSWYLTIARLKKAGVKTALYYLDLRRPLHDDVNLLSNIPVLTPYFDKVFISCKENVKAWNDYLDVETHWLPQATIQHPIPPRDTSTYNIVHIGDLDGDIHRQRRDIYNQIAPYSGIKNFNFHERDKRAILSEKSYGMYGSARFSLSVPVYAEGYTSDRFYHIMGAGGAALAHYRPGLEEFKHGEHCFWFKDIDECKKIISETTEQDLNRVKETAFRHVQSHHLYKDRFITILRNLYES